MQFLQTTNSQRVWLQVHHPTFLPVTYHYSSDYNNHIHLLPSGSPFSTPYNYRQFTMARVRTKITLAHISVMYRLVHLSCYVCTVYSCCALLHIMCTFCREKLTQCMSAFTVCIAQNDGLVSLKESCILQQCGYFSLFNVS